MNRIKTSLDLITNRCKYKQKTTPNGIYLKFYVLPYEYYPFAISNHKEKTLL